MHALRTDPPPATDALEAFVRRHQTAVWRFLRTLGCPGLEADDLTQDTFLITTVSGKQAEARRPAT